MVNDNSECKKEQITNEQITHVLHDIRNMYVTYEYGGAAERDMFSTLLSSFSLMYDQMTDDSFETRLMTTLRILLTRESTDVSSIIRLIREGLLETNMLLEGIPLESMSPSFLISALISLLHEYRMRIKWIHKADELVTKIADACAEAGLPVISEEEHSKLKRCDILMNHIAITLSLISKEWSIKDTVDYIMNVVRKSALIRVPDEE